MKLTEYFKTELQRHLVKISAEVEGLRNEPGNIKRLAKVCDSFERIRELALAEKREDVVTTARKIGLKVEASRRERQPVASEFLKQIEEALQAISKLVEQTEPVERVSASPQVERTQETEQSTVIELTTVTTREKTVARSGAAVPVLRSENLVKIYSKRKVVDQVSIRVEQGEIVGLLGPNGAGKTTTFYMITGMIRPSAGKIYLDGKDITNLPMYRRAQMGVGYLSQEPSVFRRLSVEDNLNAILEILHVPRRERKQRLSFLLDELGITHLAKYKAYTLSGGERRRVEITRALVTQPKFMLLDEPFAGVDPIAVEDIQNIVRGLKKRGIGVLITDHNVHETLSITDRAYLLYEGVVLKSGSAEFLANDPEARKLYLGDKFRLDR